MKQKYWFDTEFIEDGKTIDLISIGIICEDGRSYYAQNRDCNLKKADAWVQANVIPHLDQHSWKSKKDIAFDIQVFTKNDTPEFWADYASYDWVVLCQLYGTMMDIPRRWPMFCRDIQQLRDGYPNIKFPEQKGAEHNALDDAKYCKLKWEILNGLV